MNNKHLSSIDRSDIEACLNKGKNITEISKSIHRPYNTVKMKYLHTEKKDFLQLLMLKEIFVCTL